MLSPVRSFSSVGTGGLTGTIPFQVDKNPVAEAHKKQLKDLKQVTKLRFREQGNILTSKFSIFTAMMQYIEKKNLPVDLGLRLKGHFEFQYRKKLENQASSLVDLPRSLMLDAPQSIFLSNFDFVEQLLTVG